MNDYVVWNDGKGVEGWVYFKCPDYVTIETNVTPKDDVNLMHCSIHRNHRLLVLCYRNQWSQLSYVKSRKSPHE